MASAKIESLTREQMATVAAISTGFVLTTGAMAFLFTKGEVLKDHRTALGVSYLLASSVFAGTYLASQASGAVDKATVFAKGATLAPLIAASIPVMGTVAVLDTAANKTVNATAAAAKSAGSFVSKLGRRSPPKEVNPHNIILPAFPASIPVLLEVQPVVPAHATSNTSASLGVARKDASTQVFLTPEIDVQIIKTGKQITTLLERLAKQQSQQASVIAK